MLVRRLTKGLGGRHSLFFNSQNCLSSAIPLDLLKIISHTKSIPQFLNIFKSNKNSFSFEAYLAFYYKQDELIKNTSALNCLDAIEFIDHINKLDLSKCTAKNLLILLHIIHNFQHKEDIFELSDSSKTTLLIQFSTLIQHGTYHTAPDLVTLLEYYAELSLYNFTVVTNIVVPQIYSLSHQLLKKSGKIDIPILGVQLFLKGFKRRDVKSMEEHAVRALFIVQLDIQRQTLDNQSLLSVCLDLNQIDHYQLSKLQKDSVERLFSQLAHKVADLQEYLILRLVHSQQNKTNNINLFRVYKEALLQMLKMFDSNGFTTLQQDSLILKLMRCSSRNVHSQTFGDEEKIKCFNFLKLYLKKNKGANQQVQREVTLWLANLLDDDFITWEKRQLMELMRCIPPIIDMQLLLSLSNKRYPLQHLLKSIHLTTNQTLQGIIKYAIVLSREVKSSRRKGQATLQNIEALSKVRQTLQHNFSNQNRFKSMNVLLQRIDPTFQLQSQFYNEFPDLFAQLNKPLANDSLCSKKYSLQYVYFMYKVVHSNTTALLAFQKECQTSIDQKLLNQLLLLEMKSMKNGGQPSNSLMVLIHYKLEELVANKRKVIIKSLLTIIITYSRFLIVGELDHLQQQNMWRILHLTLKIRERLKQLELQSEVEGLVSVFIAKDQPNYHNSFNYKEFLTKCAQNIHYFKGRKDLQLLIVKELFRAKLAKLQHLQGTTSQTIEQLSDVESEKYKTLRDGSYEVQVKQGSLPHMLEALVFNKHSEAFIESNAQQIKEIIATMNIFQLQRILINYDLKSSKTSRRLQAQLVNRLVQLLHSFNSIDTGGILASCQKRHTSLITSYASFFDATVKYYQPNLHQFLTLEPLLVVELIKFTATQSPQSIKNKESFYTLADEWLKFATGRGHALVLHALASSAFPFTNKHLSKIWKIFDYHLVFAVRFFLFLEQDYDKETRIKVVTRIANDLKGRIKKGSPPTLHDLIYQYLLLQYPEQMKQVNLDAKYLQQFKFSHLANTKVIRALEQASRVLGVELKELSEFKPNIVYQFNGKLVIFTSSLKFTAVHELRFIRKAFKVVHKQSKPVFNFINSVYDQSYYIKLIAKGTPPDSEELLLSRQQCKTLMEKSSFFREQTTHHGQRNPSKKESYSVPEKQLQ